MIVNMLLRIHRMPKCSKFVYKFRTTALWPRLALLSGLNQIGGPSAARREHRRQFSPNEIVMGVYGCIYRWTFGCLWVIGDMIRVSGASRSTLKGHFKRLVGLGRLKQYGERKGTWYGLP